MKNYSSNTKKDGAGIGLFLGIFFILIGIFYSLINLDNIKKASSPPPPLPPGVPADARPLFGSTIEAGVDHYLVQIKGTQNIRVEFAQCASVKKLWNGTNAFFQLDLPRSEPAMASTHTGNWDSLLISQGPGNQPFTPWLEVNIPFDDRFLHNWVNARASLVVTYPAATGSTFSNVRSDLSHKIHFFGITDVEFEGVTERSRWENAVKNSGKVTVIGSFVCSGISFLVGLFWLVKWASYKVKERNKFSY